MKLTKVDFITLSVLVCWCSFGSEALRVTRTQRHATFPGCRIPKGYEKFTLAECDDSGACADEERASHGSLYNVTCLEDRRFATTNEKHVQMKCINGEWTPSLDEYKCLAFCPELEYKSLDLQCYHSRDRVPCNQSLVPGTTVHASCKRNYENKLINNFVNRTTCRKDGSYQYEFIECTPVCGKTATYNAQTLISKGTKVNFPKYPWHIALYWKNNNNNGSFEYQYKCGGTLIDRNKVLTAAHCIWDPTSGRLIEVNILEVASGKIYSRWDALDGSAQKVGVVEVISASSFKGFTTRYEQDIAVLILSEDLEISESTMPACLDLDLSAGGVPVGQRGHVVGWGREDEKNSSPSEILLETWMEYLDVDSCHIQFRKYSFHEYLLNDKFCVLYENGSGTQQGDSGGGLTFLHDGLHYVYGVVSIKKVGQNEFAAVTNVTSHRHWLLDILATNGMGRRCSIPQGGEIVHLKKCGDIRGCKNKNWAPLNSAYSVTCDEGYGWSTPNQTFTEIFCYQGKWIPNESQWKCLALCPAVVEHESITLRCNYRGVSVPCDQPLLPDTMVSVRCKARYKLPYAEKSNLLSETRCRSDGTIQNEVKMCVPACGRLSDVQSSLTGGHEEKHTMYPWHILIYKRKENPEDKSGYDYVCAGTLVDSNKVLTAASCIWDNNKHVAERAEHLVVISGKKHNTTWHVNDEQTTQVSKVIPSLYYNGRNTSFSQDIAMLILTQDHQFSDYSMPACLDLDLSAGGIPKGQRGQVVIWDQQVDEEIWANNSLTDILVEYLDLLSCRHKFKDNKSFNYYLVLDKFCVLYNNACGRLSYVQSSLAGGHKENPKYPWHILIYWRNQDDPEDRNNYSYVCAGTLVDSNKVLTAASCIWYEKHGFAVRAKHLVVVSGKRHYLWHNHDATEQTIQVSKVIPALNYNGFNGSFSQDIAMLILSQDFKLSDHTKPACLDLDLSAGGIPKGQRGQVVIWQHQSLVAEKIRSDPTPTDIWMDYLDLKSCRNKYKNTFMNQLIVFDKFCIHYKNNIGPKLHDAGAGIIFKHNGTHYVYGVVSVIKPDEIHFGVVTNVTSHRHWLTDVMATN